MFEADVSSHVGIRLNFYGFSVTMLQETRCFWQRPLRLQKGFSQNFEKMVL